MGGSGGGGGSGKIGYPAYVETAHNDWLDNTGADTMTDSMVDLMDAAHGNSPWAALSAYDPDADITAWEAAITAFAAILAGITDTTDWAALFTQSATSIGAATALVVADTVVADAVAVGDLVVADEVVADIADTTDVPGITEAVIVADVAAFANQLDDEILTKVLPRFRRGMQDINAVVSSAFPIGQSIIESFRDREVAKHNSAIRLSASAKNADIGLDNERLHLEVRKVNVNKDIQIGTANLGKDVNVGGANLTKDVDISRANLTKNVSIGEANLKKDVQVGDITVKTDAEYERMYLEGSSQMLRLMLQRISWQEGYMRTVIEGKRIKVVAKKEQTDMDASIDEKDAVWDLSVYQYGANLIGAPGGAVVQPRIPSATQSAIGGAMSGAVAGAMIAGASQGAIAGPTGAILGGLLGAASAFL